MRARLRIPDGSQRIILITDRRLGAVNQALEIPPCEGASEFDYEFSVIELRLNAKGEGEGKVSLTGKVAPDAAAKIVALENYDALPLVSRRAESAQRVLKAIRGRSLCDAYSAWLLRF